VTQVLGIDGSITKLGLTLVNSERPRAPHVTVVFSESQREPTIADRLARWRLIVSKTIRFVRMFDDGTPLYIVIESPLYSAKTMGSQHDRSGVWWMLLERLERTFSKVEIMLRTESAGEIREAPSGAWMERPVRFAECSPTTAKLYWTMHGHASKEAMLAAARERFPGVPIVDHNAADSVALAAMGARRLGFPMEPEQTMILPLTLNTVHWWDEPEEGTL
jgi:Holliday junction resolvasome RuvABC endonuclease subunit